MLKWKVLDSEIQLESIIEESHDAPQMIFKHSTSCPISSMAKRRLENGWTFEINSYYLDLLSFRSVSNFVSERLDIEHQSPQVIVLHMGKAIYDESHLDISASELDKQLEHHVNG